MKKVPHFQIYITTRNRPETVCRNLESLNQAVSKAFPNSYGIFNCIVLDDSTDEVFYKDFRHYFNLINAANLKIFHVTKQNYFETMQILQDSGIRAPKHNNKLFRELGAGDWDHAGVLNYAYLLAYATSDSYGITIFLDDDILFTDSDCYSHNFGVAGFRVIKELVNSAPQVGYCAVGAQYLGRSDVSIEEHFFSILDELTSQLVQPNQQEWVATVDKLLSFPHTLPMHISHSQVSRVDATKIRTGPGGISGAALATNKQSLASHGFLRIYNEDWVWLTMLGKGKQDLTLVDEKLLHCPPIQTNISERFMKYQAYGELVFDYLCELLKEVPPDIYRINWIQIQNNLWQEDIARKLISLRSEHYDRIIRNIFDIQEVIAEKATNSELNLSLPSALSGIAQATNIFVGLKSYVSGLAPEEISLGLQDYVNSIPVWRDLFESVNGQVAKSIKSLIFEQQMKARHNMPYSS